VSSSAFSSSTSGFFRRPLFRAGGDQRQVEGGRGALAGRAGELDPTAVAAHDAVGNGQAEAGPALLLGGAERLEERKRVLGQHARPAIGHRDHAVPSLPETRPLDAEPGIGKERLGGDHDVSALGHRLGRVADRLGHHLLELRGVSHHVDRLVGRRALDRDGRRQFGPQCFGGAFHDGAQLERPRFRRPAAAEIKQPLQDRRAPLDAFLDPAGVFLLGAAVGALRVEQ